ncbi:hypothetical protein [Streptomyces sp. NBC_01445]|nr:hypothetical protein [Streptomyces sp. NBC_01445]WSE11642.1 hypothetical protein OG574_51690 [Streptomyces sp. NBC_01445]
MNTAEADRQNVEPVVRAFMESRFPFFSRWERAAGI